MVLQSVDRFIQPSKLGNAVLVAAIGGAGIASNVLMVALLIGSSDTPSSDSPAQMDDIEMSEGRLHANHAHTLRPPPTERRFDLNVLGVLLHILGDAINSLAVIVSAVVFLKTGWVYADPIATLFGKLWCLRLAYMACNLTLTWKVVGCMIIGTALPLIIKTGRMLAEAAPRGARAKPANMSSLDLSLKDCFLLGTDIDLDGVHADVAAVEGVSGVHVGQYLLKGSRRAPTEVDTRRRQELHVWSLSQSKALASMHIDVASDSLTDFMTLSRKVRSCLHFWGIHAVTIQPEFPAPLSHVDGGDTAVASSRGNAGDVDTAGKSTCRVRCPSTLCEAACC